MKPLLPVIAAIPMVVVACGGSDRPETMTDPLSAPSQIQEVPEATTPAQPGAEALQPGPGGLVSVEGTELSVPGTLSGFEGPFLDRLTESRGTPAGTVLMYDKPGPIPGTVSGSFSILVVEDHAANDRLRGVEAQSNRAALAADLGYEASTLRVLNAGNRAVLKAEAADVIPGADIGQPDRVYDDYVFPGADGKSVVYVSTDVLPEVDVLSYISQIVG